MGPWKTGLLLLSYCCAVLLAPAPAVAKTIAVKNATTAGQKREYDEDSGSEAKSDH
jgi:hypothetical protein